MIFLALVGRYFMLYEFVIDFGEEVIGIELCMN